ncbi:hypothetical protein QR98_0063800 [Sarcoptes scabiei]|uniref:Uncharacterized protein n=1 Tax=Sarcoptes scabiei TaxID=52283 RepID=A0A132AA80_SARSC|nr:hypothetical protein QR98_0063800 [Sarcoptes scabiei]
MNGVNVQITAPNGQSVSNKSEIARFKINTLVVVIRTLLAIGPRQNRSITRTTKMLPNNETTTINE